MKKTIFKRIASLAMAAVMGVTACLGIGGMTEDNNVEAAAGTYKLESYTPAQILGHYGLTATDSIYINTHCHSNFLVNVLNNQANSGLNASADYDPYNKAEEFYFYTFGQLNNSQLSNGESIGYLYIGDGATQEGAAWSNGLNVKNAEGKVATINKPGPARVKFDSNYADMADIDKKLQAYNVGIMKLAETTGTNKVTYSFGDQNNRVVSCPTGKSVVNIDAGKLAVNTPTSIRFPDIDDSDTKTSVVINVDMKGKGNSVTFKDLVLAYGDAGPISNKEASAVTNHNRIYYNFYDSSNKAGNYQYTGVINMDGRGFGTIIAPSATVNLNQNWDGVVAAKNVSVNAEFHRIVKLIGAPEIEDGGDVFEEPTAEVSLLKRKSGGGALSGAKLKLTIDSASNDLTKVKANGTIVGGSDYRLSDDNKSVSWTSGNAEVKFTELPVGEYTWEETEPPAGTTVGVDKYELAAPVKFKVDADGKVYKYIGNDDYSPDPMTDDKFEMVDGLVVQGTFSKATKVKSGASTTRDVELKGAKLKITVTTSSVNLTDVKHVSASGTNVTIGNNTIEWTSGDTPVVFENLPNGEYEWEEITPPKGYKKADTVKFKIDNEKIYLYKNNAYSNTPLPAKTPIVMYDETVTATATLSKQDKNGNELAGAGLRLTMVYGDYNLDDISRVSGPAITQLDDNHYAWRWTSSSSGPLVVSELPVGEYVLEETKAPDGYKKADPVKFMVGSDGKVYKYIEAQKRYSQTPLGDSDAIIMVNLKPDEKPAPKKGNLTVTVYYDGTKNIVKDKSVITIKDPDGNTKQYETTNGKVELKDIPVGYYEIITTDVPDDYVVTKGEKIEVLVVEDETAKHDVYIKTVKPNDPDNPTTEDPNNPVNPNDPDNPTTEDPNDPDNPTTPDPTTPAGTGNLKIIVYDEKTGDIVPGATVEVTYPDGTTKKTDVTDENGEIFLGKMPVGEYTVVTTKVPDGYTVTAGKEHKAEVIEKQTTVCEVLINTDKGNLIITVYDEKTGDVVPNATVTVTYPDGSTSPYITDSEGKITLSNIPVGDYKTQTTKVPDGYTVTVGKEYTATVVSGQTTECKIYIVTSTDKSVNTGDSFKVIPIIGVMIAALFGMVIMIVRKKAKAY